MMLEMGSPVRTRNRMATAIQLTTVVASNTKTRRSSDKVAPLRRMAAITEPAHAQAVATLAFAAIDHLPRFANVKAVAEATMVVSKGLVSRRLAPMTMKFKLSRPRSMSTEAAFSEAAPNAR
jgi:hypothetical protein